MCHTAKVVTIIYYFVVRFTNSG